MTALQTAVSAAKYHSCSLKNQHLCINKP